MTLIRSYSQIIAGFVVGVLLSLLLGVLYSYSVWDPPSNDWGNEKTTDTILLMPILLIFLVIAILMRRRIFRGLRAIVALGPLGLIAILIGASIGPLWQLGGAAAEWRQVQVDLPMHRDAALKQLSMIGPELKASRSIVMYEPPVLRPEDEEKLYFRIALYTSQPVYVLISPGGKDAILREYKVETGNPCQQVGTAAAGAKPRMPLMTGGTCLTHSDMTDMQAFPYDGDVLSFPVNEEIAFYGFKHKDDQAKDLHHFMGTYYSIFVSNLKKADPPNAKYPYVINWADRTLQKISWENWCSTKMAGDYPFASGVHWQACTDILSLPDIIDRIFGPSPDIH